MNKPILNFDIVISGAGSIGLVTALLLAKRDLNIAIIDPKPENIITKVDDTRNIALMQPSLNVLKYLGIFDEFLSLSRPLRKLHIVDATNRLLRAPEVVFTAQEVGYDYFALNIPMGKILQTLCAQLPNHKNITTIFGNEIKHIEQRPKALEIELKDNTKLTSKLLIGADGRNSFARTSAKITTSTKTYPQTALGFAFKHTRDLGDTSVEFHRKNGPFTLIPMQNLSDSSQTSLVWSESNQMAAEIKQYPQEKIAVLIEKYTNGIVGEVTEIGFIAGFPLTNTNCSTYAQNRTILVGEAAHILPPIGAQGMNLGFQDAAIADELIGNVLNENSGSGADIGSDQMMQLYNQHRKTDISARGKATDLLNISLLSNLLPVQFARGLGLFMLQSSKFLRTSIMKKALHPLGKTPATMR
ncbi:MAG: FAD-dependent monooxygenase [Rhizobiales bacterium]|nr:FAD-dependent monooxygenase [Hyphomicrobiales bacterium]NRB14765.1 FAD-dependent monooxygenase [Hyphomicrobiales bacterium]